MASPLSILDGKYPAKLHLEKVLALLREKHPAKEGFLYLESQKARLLEDSDMPEPFRQRRHFYYLTGCELPDCAYIYDLARSESTLYIPDIDPDDLIWSGLPLSLSEAQHLYDVDHVDHISNLPQKLVSAPPHSTLFGIERQIEITPKSGVALTWNLTLLKPLIDASRVTKTPYEVALTRKANDTTALAHTALMRASKTAKTERDLEALFLHTCMKANSPNQAYHGIVAAGSAAATLHYVKNDAPLAGKLNLLLDAGAEYRCYASDITRTFPINGRFTEKSRKIYEIVLRMQDETIAMLKADVSWEEVHVHAHRVAIAGLLELGILHNGSAEEIFESRTSTAFFPHGLGHHLGLDTHDVGGNPDPKDKDPMFRYLRLRGRVPEGSIVTVEPGVYFCDFIIKPYLEDEKHGRYIDEKVLDGYWEVGGVRIEDNILITKDGYENLTTAPKSVVEMERLVSEGGVQA